MISQRNWEVPTQHLTSWSQGMNSRTASLQASCLVNKCSLSQSTVKGVMLAAKIIPNWHRTKWGRRCVGFSPSSNNYLLTTYSLQSMEGIQNMYKAKSLHRIRRKWEIVIKWLPSGGISWICWQGLPWEPQEGVAAEDYGKKKRLPKENLKAQRI